MWYLICFYQQLELYFRCIDWERCCHKTEVLRAEIMWVYSDLFVFFCCVLQVQATLHYSSAVCLVCDTKVMFCQWKTTSTALELEKRAIKFKGSKLWNDLPTDIKEIQSCSSFKCNLKDYLLVFIVVSFICTLFCLHMHFISCMFTTNRFIWSKIIASLNSFERPKNPKVY